MYYLVDYFFGGKFMENYFNRVYQVLKIIEYASYNKISVYELFDLEKLKLTPTELEIIITNVVKEGFVINREPLMKSSMKPSADTLYNPQLTSAGYEFLENNSNMKKAYKLIKELKEWLPGL